MTQSHFHGYFNLICPHCYARNKVEEKHIDFQIDCSNCAATIYYAPEKEKFHIIEIPTTQQHDDYGE